MPAVATMGVTVMSANRPQVRCQAGIVLLLVLAGALPALAQTGVYTLNGGTASQTGQTYAATLTDQSSVYVLNSGHLTLTDCTMTKTGDSSNVNTSSQYGLNAGVLAKSAGVVTISGGSVTTNALGANGLFATGSGSSISMSNGTINASGSGAHGVDATYTGSITLNNVNVTTNGASSSALATDFGGGTVNVTGGTIISASTASGSHSAGIYSTGSITVTGATVSSLGDCGGVIDGANSITLNNTALTGLVEGIKIWKTAPATGSATVTITGGSLTATAGDGFYVTGETGNAASATLTVQGGATVSASTGKILNVIKASTSTGSTATFTANGVTLTGNLIADSVSTITASLKNSTTLTGIASRTALTIDATSNWLGMAGSALTSLTNAGGIAAAAGSPGLLTISGTFSQASTGTLHIQLGSASVFDHLTVSSSASVAGTLDINLVNGFIPSVGQTFDIITRASGSGSFTTLASGSGLTYSVSYSGTLIRVTILTVPAQGACCSAGGSCSVTTQAACTGTWHGAGTTCTPSPCVLLGDMDCSGMVNLNDIGPFATALLDPAAYVIQHPSCAISNADMNQDLKEDALDIQLFVDTLIGS